MKCHSVFASLSADGFYLEGIRRMLRADPAAELIQKLH